MSEISKHLGISKHSKVLKELGKVEKEKRECRTKGKLEKEDNRKKAMGDQKKKKALEKKSWKVAGENGGDEGEESDGARHT